MVITARAMLTWILRRILAVVPVLFGVTLAVFSMLFLVPGDPVKMMLAEFVTNPDQVAQMRAQLHLDEPILKQYGRFVANAARGDLGIAVGQSGADQADMRRIRRIDVLVQNFRNRGQCILPREKWEP